MKIQTHLLRAALVCVAKNDPRYYLQGIHINSNYIEATNGHVAVRMEHGISTRRNSIIEFCGPVPKKAVTTEIYFTKEPYAVHRDSTGMRVGFTALKLHDDARFPDLDRVIPENHELCLPLFQARYLTYPQKMFGDDNRMNAVKFNPAGMEAPCMLEFSENINAVFGNPQLIIMPCKA